MSRQGVWQGWEAEVQRLLPGASVLEQARGGTRWLALDETHQGHTATGARLGMLALRLIYQERAIPLAWVCFVVAQGTSVLQHGFRRMLERPERRTLSVFSLGLRWLDRARFHLISPLARLLLPYP